MVIALNVIVIRLASTALGDG
jgi:hypothetical protein